METYSYEIFDDNGERVQLHDVRINPEIAQLIIRNSIDVGRILGASDKLAYAVLGAIDESEHPDYVVEGVMEGLVMGELVERTSRFSRVRETIGRITGHKPLLYVRTRNQ